MNCLIFSFIGTSQTLLINPSNEGGFELPGGLAGNGWSSVNSTVNNWFVSGDAIPFLGSNSAFISNTSGVTYSYTNTVTQTSHFYRDITVPSGNTAINLKFNYKSVGELNFDRLLVYIAPVSLTPVADVPASSNTLLAGATLVYTDLTQVNTYQQVNLFLPGSLSGTTFRLIFTWQNDNTSGAITTPASIDDIYLYSQPLAPLNGNYTINNTLPTSNSLPSAGSNFVSFTDAINYLNVHGVSGPVTFNVAAAQTFPENPQIITATGAATNTITFQKNGTGLNPKFIGKNGIGGLDACFTLSGSDYITFDGIDLETFSGSLTGNQKMEFGYYVINASATDGAKRNIIKNSKISLDRSNNCMGIYQNVTNTPSSLAGTNSNNLFSNIVVENSFQGIFLLSNASFQDDSCIVRDCFIGGNTPFDIGGGNTASACAGIWVRNLKNCKVFNNTIKNIATQALVYGIFIENGYGICEVYNNKISAITNNSPTSTAAASGIRANVPASTAGAHTIRIYNNFISEIASSYSGASSAVRIIRGINLQAITGGGNTASVFEVTHNSVNIDGSNSLNCSSTCFEIGTTSGPIYKIRNNIFSNFTANQSGVSKHYCWRSTSATSIGNTGSVSDYNDLYIANTSNGFVGIGNATDYQTLSNWQSLVPARDNNSISVDPIFNSTTDLHVVNTLLNAAASDITLTPYIVDDIDQQSRINPTDIGADEFTPLTYDVKTLALISPSNVGCYSSSQSVTVDIKNYTAVPLDFSVNPVNMVVLVSGAVTQTVSFTINDNQLNGNTPLQAFSNLSIPVGLINMSAYGTYTITCYVSWALDQNHFNDTISNIIRLNSSPALLPQMVDFTNFNGTNLTSTFAGWQEAVGVVPAFTNSAWLSGSLVNTNARVTMNTTSKNEWIISPKIIPISNTVLSYKSAVTAISNASAGTMGTDDFLYLMISTDCGLSFQKLDSLTSNSGLTNSFSQFFYPLNNYAGQEVILAFQAKEGATTNSYDLHLEDINISNITSYDLSITNLNSPIQKNCYLSNEEIVVVVKNTGPITIDFANENVTIVSVISGQINQSYSLTLNSGILNPNASATYTVSSGLNFQNAGVYYINSYANIPSGDINTSNDTIKQVLYSQNPSVLFSQPTVSVCINDSVQLLPSISINGFGLNTLSPLKNTDGPFIIPDNLQSGITSTIQVSGVGGNAAQVVEVRIDSLIHSFVGDLVITLIAPNGSSIQLSANNGSSGNNYISSIFSSNSNSLIVSGVAPFTGNFLPQQSFNLLTGSANGLWQINVKDISNLEVGTFYKWSLVFNDTNSLSSFSWNPISNISNVNSLTPKVGASANATYTLTVTDSQGCSASASQDVIVNQLPIVSLGNDTSICEGNLITLDAGIGFNSYTWSNGTNVQQTTINQQGIYSVIVTNSVNCVNADTVFIAINQNPIISLSIPNDSICDNSAAITCSFTPSGGVFSGAGVNQLGVFTPQFLNSGNSIIYYQFTDSNGCSSLDSTSIEVLQSPSVSLALTSSTVCSNSGTLSLSGGSPLGGVYSGNGVTSNSFDPSVSGVGNQTIFYSFSSLNGCSNIDSSDIEVLQSPSVSLSLNTSTVCSNSETLSLSGGLPLGGVYSGNGVTSNSFDPSVSGVGNQTIFYSFSSLNGCSNLDSSNIEVLQSPSVSLALNTSTVCSNSGTLSLSGGLPVGGIYSGNGVLAPDVFDPLLAGIGTSLITYNYEALNGCSDSASESIFVDNCSGFLSQVFENVSIYPNPTTDYIYLENIPIHSKIYLFDITGKQLLCIENQERNLKLNLLEFSAGTYLIKFHNLENLEMNYKFLKN